MGYSKTILLVDAVEWAPIYPQDHPLRSVPKWFLRHFAGDSSVEWIVKGYHQLPLDDVLADCNGVMITGSPRDAWADDPINELMCALVGSCMEREIPFLGVCYGHQILGRALGARVGRHPQGLQLGPVTMNLTEEGQEDCLFGGMENAFEALSGHADYVRQCPDAGVLLASGGDTEVQAMRIGARTYGVQFHPEMNADILKFLWQARIAAWESEVSFDLRQRVEEIYDTPVAVQVLKNFVERVV